MEARTTGTGVLSFKIMTISVSMTCVPFGAIVVPFFSYSIIFILAANYFDYELMRFLLGFVLERLSVTDLCLYIAEEMSAVVIGVGTFK